MESVFEPKTVTITLAGLSFDWTEAPRRKTRAMMRDLLPIGEFDNENPSQMLEAVDAILDFFYKHHPDMAAARAVIDDTATEAEIAEAFREVSQLIVGPFAATVPEAKE